MITQTPSVNPYHLINLSTLVLIAFDCHPIRFERYFFSQASLFLNPASLCNCHIGPIEKRPGIASISIMSCGKPILFIHGWPANHKMFEYQFDQLPKMRFRCIGMDIRGFGNSDKPWSGYNYDRLADDVRGVVEALKLQNFTLGAHSVGGAIAIRYMARHNGYGVSKLALFAAAAPSFTKRPDFPYGFIKEDLCPF